MKILDVEIGMLLSGTDKVVYRVVGIDFVGPLKKKGPVVILVPKDRSGAYQYVNASELDKFQVHKEQGK